MGRPASLDAGFLLPKYLVNDLGQKSFFLTTRERPHPQVKRERFWEDGEDIEAHTASVKAKGESEKGKKKPPEGGRSKLHRSGELAANVVFESCRVKGIEQAEESRTLADEQRIGVDGHDGIELPGRHFTH